MSAPNDARFAAIADFVLSPTLVVPEDALHHCATLLIDTLGVAAGAVPLEAGRIARDFAVDFHAASRDEYAATMLFDGRRVSIPGAGWALATQIDNLDGHDGYNPTKGHIGCAVVPALLAFAEHAPGLTGRDALTALAMSYEVAARAGIALHASVSDYHTSGAWNALGVAALGCRLSGDRPEVLRQALGIAEYHGPRSQMMREIDNPTMLHDGSGMGALVGSTATLMARRGFTGAPAITVEAPEAAQHWADLGEAWTVGLNYIKPYPVCRWAHAAMDALNHLIKTEGVTAENMQSVTVRTFAESARLFDGVPRSTSQAQYGLRFNLAALMVHGRVGAEHISGAGLSDPDVIALMPRISVVEDPRHSDRFPLGRWSDLDVTLKDGRVIQSGDVHARGGPEAWMEDAEVEAKFHSMAGTLDSSRRHAIWAMRDRLLEPDVPFCDLTNLLHSAPENL
ncbi:MmgE/PrpD family protein [Roseovarius pelagicus]|uniref:MmgE/PrpD family protein n=1 Tax=Roseovarius pelagicus TaxID=2980108 RepID=A0ABY6D6T1_9RHOB|nr:MmgE/PrpD family protein [Roseovarius pelagicus]UXX81846.1 MmgE/PrpD family protein [Roseovarius pelagicus]